jgi:hypothetical protein
MRQNGSLRKDVHNWATPAAADARGSAGGGQGRSLRTDIHDMPDKPAGSLNPAWVAQLMGFPDGWLDGPAVPAKISTRGKRPERLRTKSRNARRS